MDTPNYFSIIPAEVRYNDNLSPAAKLFYSEISCLTNKEGYCYASNQYFINLYKVNETTIIRWINQLIQEGYITRELIYKNNSKEVESRYLRIVTLSAKMQVGTCKNDTTLPAKMQVGTCKNANDNSIIIIDNNNIDIVDEKILFSQSIYFERFSLFESDMKKEFTKKNIDFSYYYKTICNGKKTQSEKYTNTEWKQFFINAIQFLIDKNGLVKIEKEKTQLHSFEKSIYYDNYELFKTEFEENYPDIDSKYYYDEFSLSCKAKGYKNIDWKAVFQKWINKLQGDYKKINQTSQSEQKSFLDIDWNEFLTIIKAKNTKSLCAKYGITDKHQYVEMAQKLKEKRQVKDENGEFIYPDGQRFYVWQVYGNMLSDFQYSE